jgi:hypothetical protein
MHVTEGDHSAEGAQDGSNVAPAASGLTQRIKAAAQEVRTSLCCLRVPCVL